MKKILGILLILISFWATPPHIFSANTGQQQEFEQLRLDFQKISNAEKSGEHITDFYNENKEWIEDVSHRLEIYLSRFPNDQRSFKINEITNNAPMQRAYSGNFNWTKYHMRGGRWTYSMNPKWSVRLNRFVALDGWAELKRIYPHVNTNSLYYQYMCHFELFVELNDWDIERGRPDVGYWGTIWNKCNP